MPRSGAATPTKSKQDLAGPAVDGSAPTNQFNHLTLETNGRAMAAFNNSVSCSGASHVPNNGHGADTEGISPTAGPSAGQLQPSAAVFLPATRTSDRPTSLEMLNKNSVPDPTISNSTKWCAEAVRPPYSHSNGKAPVVDQQPIGTGLSNFGPAPTPSTSGRFSTDVSSDFKYLTHYVKITKVKAVDFQEPMQKLHDEYGWKHKILSQKFSKRSSSNTNMILYLCLDDMNDCHVLRQHATEINQDWMVVFINQAEYDAVEAHSNDGGNPVSRFDGQAKIYAYAADAFSHDHVSGVGEFVYDLAKTFGQVHAFQQTDSVDSESIEFRVEYRKWSDAKLLIENVTTVQPCIVGSWAMVASKFFDAYTPPRSTMLSEVPRTPRRQTAAGQVQVSSPTGRSGWTIDESGNQQPVPMSHPAFPTGNRMNFGQQQYVISPSSGYRYSVPTLATTEVFEAMDHNLGIGRSASYPGSASRTSDSEPQQVSPDKIKAGVDVRTTIMLRNLPNRWHVNILKQVLDITSHGKYDFSYLRIDFAYNTNVGYAFVNFTDPLHIVDFVQHWVGREWSPRNGGPRKIAQVSYATVQGYDCLVEKFRNSAIMDEFPGFRPKLWYTFDSTSDTSLVGTEKPFPGPNNLSKKQRSSDNAGSIGLFAPRSGQRGGERARRSHWDRGTTRQIQEDAAFYNQYSPYYTGHAVQPPIDPPSPFYPNQHYGPYGGYPPYMGYGDGFGVYGLPPPPPFFPGGGYQYPAVPFYAYSNGYTPVNPASGLRTISNGRLAGRPRNVTVQPGNEDLFQSGHAVPRSFGGVNGQQQFDGGEDFASTVRSHVVDGTPYPQSY